MLNGMKRVILWDYERASWQYDIMVAAILVFLFFMPRSIFHDRPRVPQSHEIALLPSSSGSSVFWLEPALVEGIPPADRMNRVASLLRTKTGRVQTVERLDPVYDSEQEIKGYMAVARP